MACRWPLSQRQPTTFSGCVEGSRSVGTVVYSSVPPLNTYVKQWAGESSGLERAQQRGPHYQQPTIAAYLSTPHHHNH